MSLDGQTKVGIDLFCRISVRRRWARADFAIETDSLRHTINRRCHTTCVRKILQVIQLRRVLSVRTTRIDIVKLSTLEPPNPHPTARFNENRANPRDSSDMIGLDAAATSDCSNAAAVLPNETMFVLTRAKRTYQFDYQTIISIRFDLLQGFSTPVQTTINESGPEAIQDVANGLIVSPKLLRCDEWF